MCVGAILCRQACIRWRWTVRRCTFSFISWTKSRRSARFCNQSVSHVFPASVNARASPYSDSFWPIPKTLIRLCALPVSSNGVIVNVTKLTWCAPSRATLIRSEHKSSEPTKSVFVCNNQNYSHAFWNLRTIQPNIPPKALRKSRYFRSNAFQSRKRNQKEHTHAVHKRFRMHALSNKSCTGKVEAAAANCCSPWFVLRPRTPSSFDNTVDH